MLQNLLCLCKKKTQVVFFVFPFVFSFYPYECQCPGLYRPLFSEERYKTYYEYSTQMWSTVSTPQAAAKLKCIYCIFERQKLFSSSFFCKDQLRLHAFREQSSTYLLCLLQETNFVCISSHLEVPIEHESSIWNNLWTHSANLKIALQIGIHVEDAQHGHKVQTYVVCTYIKYENM